MTIKPENVNTSPKRVDKMEEIIKAAREVVAAIDSPKTTGKQVIGLINKRLRQALPNTPKAVPRTDEDYCDHEAPLNEMDCCPVCDAQFLPEEPST